MTAPAPVSVLARVPAPVLVSALVLVLPAVLVSVLLVGPVVPARAAGAQVDVPSFTGVGPADAATTGGWLLPVGPPGGPAPVVRGFDPPDQPWLSGHRGVDLAAAVGTSVRSAAAGTVAYAGRVGGVGVVAVSHGDVRSTYQPVSADVRAGDRVDAGDVVGTLEATRSHCAPQACLHWGARRGDTYVDPLSLLSRPGVRLLPLDDRAITEEGPPQVATGLAWPVAQPYVTSPFGMRVHPVTGIRKLHDGTDFRAPCGAPIRASAPGVVTDVGSRGAYGLQISVDHGHVGGVRTTTSSSHLSRLDVGAGQRVTTGQVIGRSGTTGSSTGCHLHFMVYSDGAVVDPMSRLGPAGDREAASTPASAPVPTPTPTVAAPPVHAATPVPAPRVHAPHRV